MINPTEQNIAENAPSVTRHAAGVNSDDCSSLTGKIISEAFSSGPFSRSVGVGFESAIISILLKKKGKNLCFLMAVMVMRFVPREMHALINTSKSTIYL